SGTNCSQATQECGSDESRKGRRELIKEECYSAGVRFASKALVRELECAAILGDCANNLLRDTSGDHIQSNEKIGCSMANGSAASTSRAFPLHPFVTRGRTGPPEPESML